MVNYPVSVPAIRVQQPLGVFYAAAIPVEVLLQTTYSEKVRAKRVADDNYEVEGGQRLQKPERLDDIAKFINRDDSSFPNSIILAANYRDDGRVEGDSPDEAVELAEDPLRWEIVTDLVERAGQEPLETHFLIIPSEKKLAAVIDGQHRLYAFAKAEPRHLRDELLCAVFMDLPKPMQAQIFAIINSTQKPVSKSLTYELFGYNVEDEEEQYWSPDKLAVFLTRRLAVGADSPLRNRIIVAPENSFASAARLANAPWKVSFATIVTGIVRLISSNAKDDANLLMTPRRSRKAGPGTRLSDKSVLRDAYLDANDRLIYDVVRNFARACDDVFWEIASAGSYIRKTVGVQALFDVMRDLVREGLADSDLTVDFFKRRLAAARHIDFSDERFQNPSGSGRSFIRRLLQANMRMPFSGQLSAEDQARFVR